MAQMTVIQKVAKWADICRRTGGRFEVHHQKGTRQRVMTNIHWARKSETGRRTRFVVECLDDGEKCCYTKDYDMKVTKVIVVAPNGQRDSLPPAILG